MGGASAEVTLVAAAVAAKAAAFLRGGAQSCETLGRLGQPSKSVSLTSKPPGCEAREGKKSRPTRVTVGCKLSYCDRCKQGGMPIGVPKGPKLGNHAACCELAEQETGHLQASWSWERTTAPARICAGRQGRLLHALFAAQPRPPAPWLSPTAMASCSVKLAGGKLAVGRRMPQRCHRGETCGTWRGPEALTLRPLRHAE